jgi:Tfp pilus assembly protein PilV
MTLIEVLIALFVFAIGSLAIAAMTFMSIQGNSLSNRMTQASLMAQDKMEELMSSQDLTLVPLNTDHIEANIDSEGVAGGSYTRNWVATSQGPTAASRWVNVEVSWNDAKGDHRVVIRSLWRAL